MSKDFEPSPRASKRRKVSTYSSHRSTRTETNNPVSSLWDSVSSSVTGLSRRLFPDSKDSTQPTGSVVELEDDIQLAQESPGDVENIREIAESESESCQEGVVSTRRSSRREGGLNTRAPASKIRAKTVNQDSDKARDFQKNTATGEIKQKAGATSRSASRRSSGEGVDAPGDSGRPTTAEMVMDNGEEECITVQPRSSGRERKKTRKYSTETAEIRESPKLTTKQTSKAGTAKQNSGAAKKTEQPVLVGILTPSKRNEKKARKSVVLDEGEKQIETDFGFRDIASSAKKAQESVPDPQQRSKISVASEKSKQKPRGEPVVVQPETETDSRADEELLFETLSKPVLDITASQPDYHNLTEDSPELLHIKAAILARLTNRAAYTARPPIPSHLKSAYDTVHTLLRTTVASGESNSLLLLGSRGAGKSLLVNTALEELRHDLSTEFHTVRLNGFIQTDDRLALREIWRQLGREMEVDESETNQVVGSYADTMTSLLGLLSQPEQVPDIGPVEYAAAKVVTRSVVFVLDEFDLFTTHPRQTLLYNLFDIAQSRKAPIAVIGCSARTDCVECLEKRVKSRFSHRWVHIPQPRNLVAFEEVVRDNLLVDEMRLGATALDHEWAGTWNEYITASSTLAASGFIHTNNSQTTFLPSPSIQALLSSTFHTTRSLPTIFAALYHPIATASIPTAPPSVHPDIPSLLSLLPSLPHIHLALLVCATRLEAIHSLTTCNFNIVHAHYTDLMSKSRLSASAGGASASGMRMWGRDVCLRAWQELLGWELVVRVGRDEGGRLDAGMCRVDVAIEEVRWAVEQGGLGDGLGRWCREV